MTITAKADSLKVALDAASPNTIADAFRKIGLGSMLVATVTCLMNKVPVAGQPQLATLNTFKLPEEAKAATLLRVYGKTAVAGAELTIVAYGVTPAAGQCAIAPNGDIVVLAADAHVKLDITYIPDAYSVVELTLPVVAGALVIPAPIAALGVKALLEATGVAGAVTGAKIVLVPGAAPATTQARLNTLKDSVLFNAGTDALTSATVKLAIAPSIDAQAQLLASSLLG